MSDIFLQNVPFSQTENRYNVGHVINIGIKDFIVYRSKTRPLTTVHDIQPITIEYLTIVCKRLTCHKITHIHSAT